MTPFTFLDVAIRPAMSLLPAQMDTPAARAAILTICLQESDLQHRRQKGDGPARGYAQFEQIGCSGVLMHPASRFHALKVCKDLDVHPVAADVWRAIEYNDVLCAAFSRLYLWTNPQPLPDQHNFELLWEQYLRTWRPGAYMRGWKLGDPLPRYPEKWRGYHGVAWSVVQP